jgi:hypothetical protein
VDGYLSAADWNVFNNKQPTAFTPSTPGNWTSVPTSVQQALDNLAAMDIAASGINRSIISVTSTLTGAAASKVDYVYLLGAGAVYTQPTAVGNTNCYTLKNVHTTSKTISFTSGQTADGSSSITLTPNTSVDLISDNSNWRVL